jgi:REP-associated tyrosine transposase
MPRSRRLVPPGYALHVINRGNRRQRLFASHSDYDDFLALMRRAADRHPMRLLAYCLMPNHWHLVVWPTEPAALSAYMHWLTSAHVRQHRWRTQTIGEGHLYQGRYWSNVIIDELRLIAVCRYVEGNALAATLAPRAEDWPYGSLSGLAQNPDRPALAPWPTPKPANWVELVNTV